jgi:hypothetical protein
VWEQAGFAMRTKQLNEVSERRKQTAGRGRGGSGELVHSG